ncbi:hypothetical protein FBQ95_08075 [Chloroflexi bacterium CFX3]|nr:hypothetical protein [Chloroflexi bacterium CFX3]
MKQWLRTLSLALSGVILFGVVVQAAAQGGVNPAEACGRTLANLTRLVQSNYVRVEYPFKPASKPTDTNYCQALEQELNLYLERVVFAQDIDVANGIAGRSKDAFAFLDLAAQRFVGVLPSGTAFTAVARNTLPGSQMMFVRGQGFSLFVDYAFTTLTREDFESLIGFQEYDGSIDVSCTAQWCKPPSAPPNR